MSQPDDRPSDADVEKDPSAELGITNPVRDKAKIGDAQYSVTPPREKVIPPSAAGADTATCSECQTELDPARSYRRDGEEYVYHFCGADCYERWRTRADSRGGAAPKV